MEEGEDTKPGTHVKRKVSRKLIAVMVALAIISVSSFYIWYEYYRHWSVEDLESAVITWEYGSMSSVGIDLGFKTYLEGRTVTVEDRVEYIRSMDTTIGRMNLIGLEGGEFVQLLKWGALDFAEGDRIEMDVTFERSTINGAEHVFSPQVGFPGCGMLASCQVYNQAVSWANSGGWAIDVEDLGDDVVIRVDRSPDPVMLGLARCSIKAGESTGSIEYLDITGMYGDKPDMDTIPELGNPEAQNGTLEFVDENKDGYLDEGDALIMHDLIRPETASGAQTYLVRADRDTYPDERRLDPLLPNVFCAYLMMTEKGALWSSPSSPQGAAFVSGSEDGITIVMDYMSSPTPWDDLELLVSDGTDSDKCSPDGSLLDDGTASSCLCGTLDIGQLELECRVVDMEGNGLLEARDRIVLTPVGGTCFNETRALTCSVKHMLTETHVLHRTYTPGLEPTSECQVSIGEGHTSITLGPIYNGSDRDYQRVDVLWDDMIVVMSDGENEAEWHLTCDELDGGVAASWISGDTELGDLSLACMVGDLQGNGLANTGDSVKVMVQDGGVFSPIEQYEFRLEHVPTGACIFSAVFTG